MRISLLLLSSALGIWLAGSASAQFESTDNKGAKLDKALTQRIKIGMTITARGGPCKGIVGTAPVPTNWPEQQVEVVEEDVTPNVKKVDYRTIAGGVKQMVVHIPSLAAGEQAKALITFEVKRSSLLPPDDTSIYSIPKKVDRDMIIYLGQSPFIETRHAKMRALAKELGGDLEGWAKVEAIYDGIREKVEYKEGKLKGALAALNDGTGDCEELSSLFIAVCRNAGIPSRIVWVEGHCYPEFYLVDSENNGHWFPCQAAGTRAFGGIPEHRPILQKGDNFKDPDRPKERLRYVSEYLTAKGLKGGGEPKVDFVRELVAK